MAALAGSPRLLTTAQAGARQAVGRRQVTVQRIRTLPPRNLEAYELVLKGRQGFMAFSRQGAFDAHELLQQATALDPDYAPSWELLARVLMRFYITTYDERFGSPAVLEQAHAAALKAESLDPNLSLAHGALGYVLLWQRRYDESKSSLRRAIELNPNDADSYRNYCDALGQGSEHRDSIATCEKALRLEPFSPPIVAGLIARAHIMLGEYDRAFSFARECTDRAPDLPLCITLRAIAASQVGRADEAQAAVKSLLQRKSRAAKAGIGNRQIAETSPRRLLGHGRLGGAAPHNYVAAHYPSVVPGLGP